MILLVQEACVNEVKLIRMQMDAEASSINSEYVGLSVMDYLRVRKAVVGHLKVLSLCLVRL